MFNYFFSFFLLLYTSFVSAQVRTFTKAQLQEDYAFFQKSIETYNPGLYTLTPKTEFDAYFETIGNQLEEGMTDTEFYKSLMQIIEKTNEAHFRVSSSLDAVTNIYKPIASNQARYLPLQFKFVEGKAYLWADFGANAVLERGDEILAINGDDMKIIVDSLFQFIVSDGFITSSKYARLDASFNLFYYWFYAQPFVFKIKVKSKKDKNVKTVTIPAINRKEMFHWMRKRYPNSGKAKKTPFYELSFDKKSSTAYLALKSFSIRYLKQEKVNPKKVYKEIFTKIQESGSENLIFDLRNNGGGHKKFTLTLLPYLLKAPQKGTLYTSTSWKGRTKTYKIPKRSPLAFAGNVYVLVNGRTFSAGANTSAFIKEFSEGTVIGEESGGRYLGFVAGSSEKVILPNTRIPVYIPRWEFKMYFVKKQLDKGRGVLPDHRIIPTIDDLLNGKDVQKEFVMKLIENEEQ